MTEENNGKYLIEHRWQPEEEITAEKLNLIEDSIESVDDRIAELYDIVDTKAPIANPEFTGSISLGRRDNTQIGNSSAAIGSYVVASGDNSHAEGNQTTASGINSHAEGNSTYARDINSHAEGDNTVAVEDASHAEGHYTRTSGIYAHAEGTITEANGIAAHADGSWTRARGDYSHAEGADTIASGIDSHAEGYGTQASAAYSHAEGQYTVANHRSQHVFGEYNRADGSSEVANERGNYIEIVGNGIANSRSNARTLNWNGDEWLAGTLRVNKPYGLMTDGNEVVTVDYVTNALMNATAEGGGIDLTGYAKVTNPEFSGSISLGRAANSYLGDNTSAVGFEVIASGDNSHAEGTRTEASGTNSHAEGAFTLASGTNAHSEGVSTIANHRSQHVFGEYNIEDTSGAINQERGNYVEIVGNGQENYLSNARTLDWNGNEVLMGKLTVGAAPTEDMDVVTKSYVDTNKANINNPVFTGSISLGRKNNTTIGTSSVATGLNVEASGNYSYAEGNNTKATTNNTHAEGNSTTASGTAAHAEGNNTAASGVYSHAEGDGTEATGSGAHSEGSTTHAIGNNSHAEGSNTIATGAYAHAEGYQTSANNLYAHAEGSNTTASGQTSHAEGSNTTASGVMAHTEGDHTTASGRQSHAEGLSTTASGAGSHSEGNSTQAKGSFSHAEGIMTVANREGQHVFGKYNIIDNNGDSNSRGQYVEIVGNGDEYYRTNARTLTWTGDEWLARDLTVNRNAIINGNLYTNGDTTTSINDKIANAVSYEDQTEDSNITEEQRAQARENIGAADATVVDTFNTRITAAQNKANLAASNASLALTRLDTAETTLHSHFLNNNSFVSGTSTMAEGLNSHAEGKSTTATHRSQFVFGEFNEADESTASSSSKGNYIEIVGNGTNDSNRNNARTLDWGGNERLAGDIYTKGVSLTQRLNEKPEYSTIENINKTIDNQSITWIKSTVNTEDGKSLIDSSTRLMVYEYINLDYLISIQQTTGYQLCYFMYDSEYQYLGRQNWFSSTNLITADAIKTTTGLSGIPQYIRLLMRIGNGTNDISLEEQENVTIIIKDNRIDVIEQDLTELTLSTPMVSTDDSKSVVYISNALAAPAKVTVRLDPIQDLHGFDKPWVGGTGKNKLSLDLATLKSISANTGDWNDNVYSINNVNFTVDDSRGTILVTTDSGGATYSTNFIIANSKNWSSEIIHILNGDAEMNTSGDSGLGCINARQVYKKYCHGKDWILPSNRDVDIVITIPLGFEAPEEGLLFKPMIRENGESSEWEPYSNICYLTEYTNIDIIQTGKNLMPPEKEGTISNVTGEVNASETSYYHTDQIKIESNTAYTFSYSSGSTPINTQIRVFFYDNDKKFIKYENIGNGQPRLIVTDEKTKYIAFRWLKNLNLNQIQLEHDTKATLYEPYIQKIKSFNLAEMFEEPFYGGSITIDQNGVCTINSEWKSFDLYQLQNYITKDTDKGPVGRFRCALPQNFPRSSKDTLSRGCPEIISSHIPTSPVGQHTAPTLIKYSDRIFYQTADKYYNTYAQAETEEEKTAAAAEDLYRFINDYLLPEYESGTSVYVYYKIATPWSIILSDYKIKTFINNNIFSVNIGNIKIGYFTNINQQIDYEKDSIKYTQLKNIVRVKNFIQGHLAEATLQHINDEYLVYTYYIPINDFVYAKMPSASRLFIGYYDSNKQPIKLVSFIDAQQKLEESIITIDDIKLPVLFNAAYIRCMVGRLDPSDYKTQIKSTPNDIIYSDIDIMVKSHLTNSNNDDEKIALLNKIGPTSCVHISDGSANCSTKIEIPIEPWIGGGGDNELPSTRANSITCTNGIIINALPDGTYHITGSPTKATTYYVLGNGVHNEFINKYLSGAPKGDGSGTYRLEYYDETTRTSAKSYDYPNRVIPISENTEGHTCRIVIRIESGYTDIDLLFKPMIQSVQTESIEYEPYGASKEVHGYENIEIARLGETSIEQKFNVNLQELVGTPVYGGKLTINEDGSAILVVDREYIELVGDFTSVENNNDIFQFSKAISEGISDVCICNQYEYGGNITSMTEAKTIYPGTLCTQVNEEGLNFVIYDSQYQDVNAFNTALSSNPLQIVYKLKQPKYYTFDAKQFTTVQGINRFVSTTGKIAVTYKKDLNSALEQGILTNLKSDNYYIIDNELDKPVNKISINDSYAETVYIINRNVFHINTTFSTSVTSNIEGSIVRNEDNSVAYCTLSGIATGDYYQTIGSFQGKAGYTYRFYFGDFPEGCSIKITKNSSGTGAVNGNGLSYGNVNNDSVFTPDVSQVYHVYASIVNQTIVDNWVFRPMIVVNEETSPTVYQPAYRIQIRPINQENTHYVTPLFKGRNILYRNHSFDIEYYCSIKQFTDMVGGRVINISQTQPVITAMPNCLYICDTIDTLTFIPASKGKSEVIFTSPAQIDTQTVVSGLDNVLWVDNFNLDEDIQAQTTYKLTIYNGKYGEVTQWSNSNT